MDRDGPRLRPRIARAALAVALVVAVVVLAAARTTEGRGSEANADADASPADADGPTTTESIERVHSGPVLILGDSLALGADDQGLTKLLMADGWKPQIVAETGRSTRGGILAARQDLRAVPALVIVELGTNPSSAIGTFAEEVDTMVDLLQSKGAQRIVWITPVHHDDDRYDDKANVLFAKAEADPRVVVADWRPVAWAHKSWFRPDGLHYNPPGFAALAQFIVDAADTNDPAAR